ncbi:DNA-directed RNA polymerase protein [Dioscorea alata]|uniref:DNA-directed RNA polymerase protein n=1 Tax=Dioscorea alata TaxID=55571 RepID=A0ACB7V651_DIOAL|nr:DNA-directed RNA polymerase protein [Dioscorea alata]
MIKPIRRIVSHRNRRIGSHKNARRIPKGVIHVQESFNNTIVTILDVRGQVVSWASTGTSGFKVTRRGTPYAAQVVAVNEIAESTRTLHRKCVKSRVESKEIEGTCITCEKSENVPHEYSTVVGIEESVDENLLNLKEIVLRSNLYEIRDTSIYVKGPRYITAQDIISPPYVEIVDTTQYIANLIESIDSYIKLQIKRDSGYRMKPLTNSQGGSYPIDAGFMPIRNANHSIHSYANGNENQEILFIEICTNGSLTPKEALYEASYNLFDLFVRFLHGKEVGTNFDKNKNKFTLSSSTFQDRLSILKKNKMGIPLKYIFIEQSKLPSRTYNCLKRSNIHTLLDLLSMEDVKQIFDTLQKHFAVDLPKVLI